MSGAALTEERRASLLAYCKLTELEADPEVADTIEGLYQSAVAYLEGAGVAEPEAGTPRRAQYDLAVNYLVLDGYDHRDLNAIGTTVVDNPAWRHLMTQLKVTGSGLF